jgi:steroid delta-isomerase-like uncharacterized protein
MSQSHPIIAKLSAAWNAHRAADVVALYAPNAVMVHPMAPEPLKGREAIAAFEQPMFAAFSNTEWTCTDSFSSGDRVAIEYVINSTNSGPMQTPKGTIPATNKRIRLLGTSLLRIAPDGSILEEKRTFDALSFMAQLGLAG